MYQFFVFATELGNPPIIAAVFLTLFLVALMYHRERITTLFLVALISGSLTAFFLKEITNRPRPMQDLTLDAYGSSFPSAHALIATICYGFVAFYIWRYTRGVFLKILALIIGVGVPLIVGISRVYLGVHWVSDVLAGWFIGAIILGFCIVLCRKYDKMKTINH